MSASLSTERRIKLGFFLFALFLFFIAIATISNLLVSLIFAIVTAYMLLPAVDFLERRGLSRKLATVLPFLLLTLSFAIVIQVFFPIIFDQTQNLKESFPKYLDAISQFANRAEHELNLAVKNIYPLDLKSSFEPQVLNWLSALFQDLPNYISKSLMVLFLSPLIAFFILMDGRNFVRGFLSLVPNNFFELALNLNHQIGSQIGGFIRARFVQSTLVGLVIWIGLVALGFPYALVLAIFAGILNVIPYLGPLVGVVPALIISFANGGSPSELLWITTIYATAQILDAVIITPFVVAKIVDLHPVTVILVIIAGSQLMGILGMIICIPVFSALKVTSLALYKHLTDFRS